MPIATDTLRVAPAMLESWRSDDKYDYAREFASSGFSVWGWLMKGIERLMSSIFGKHFYAEYSLWIWLALTVIALAVIVVLIIRARPALFYGTRRDLRSTTTVSTASMVSTSHRLSMRPSGATITGRPCGCCTCKPSRP